MAGVHDMEPSKSGQDGHELARLSAWQRFLVFMKEAWIFLGGPDILGQVCRPYPYVCMSCLHAEVGADCSLYLN